MPGKWKQSFSLCLALLFVLAAGVEAQTAETGQSQLPASVVTASPAGEQARFTAPAGVAQMRIEVFTAAGEKVFDSGFKPGNLLDWPFEDHHHRAGHVPLRVGDDAVAIRLRQIFTGD